MPALLVSPSFTSALVSTTSEADALCLAQAKSLEKEAEEQLFSLCMTAKPSCCSSAKVRTKDARQVPALALETGCLSPVGVDQPAPMWYTQRVPTASLLLHLTAAFFRKKKRK